jgi:hypothetical protein
MGQIERVVSVVEAVLLRGPSAANVRQMFDPTKHTVDSYVHFGTDGLISA